MGKHDHSYKLLFSHSRMVADLLRGFVKEDWVKRVDFSTLERVSGSYVADDLREREDDMIWRMRYGREWVYLYLLLEFQSTVDPYMAVRIMTYIGLLYQDLIRNKAVKRGQKLPVVLPLVLYNGEKTWKAPTRIQELILPLRGDLARFRKPLEYVLLEERTVPKRNLQGGPNLVSLLFRLEQSRDEREICAVLDEFAPWLEARDLEQIKRSLATWIQQVVMLGRGKTADMPAKNLMEVRSMLAERMRKREQQIEYRALRKGRKEGRKEGHKEGRKEELHLVIQAALEARFQRVPDDLALAIRQISDIDRLSELHREAVTTSSLQSFKKQLSD